MSSAPSFAALRQTEFGRLDGGGEVYLDYTGAALHPASLVRRQADRLNRTLLGNPHSAHRPSTRAAETIASARAAVLAFFEADPDEYAVAFTANASAAFRLVGEAFPFGPGGPLVLSADNHNSVNGLREFARAKGAATHVLPLDDELRPLDAALPPGHGLLAFPAQSNFSGVRHPLSLIVEAQAAGHRVLLDAAAFVPTSPMSLSVHRPDFVGLSFYKMFGWPTGLGALVARHEALDELERPWFAGGTVDWVTIQGDRHQRITGPERFEDGTPSFLSLAAVPDGLRFLTDVGMDAVRNRIGALTAYLLDGLPEFVTVYGPTDLDARGGTVALNVRDRDGRSIPYWQVERAAAEAGIAVRGGCFCNPGASEVAFAMAAGRSDECLDRLGSAFTPEAFGGCLGSAVGAVRVSLGIPTMEAELDRLIGFLEHLHRTGAQPRTSGHRLDTQRSMA